MCWVWVYIKRSPHLRTKTDVPFVRSTSDTVDGSEILHHLGCIKPWKWWDKLPTSTGEWTPDFWLPSTESLDIRYPSSHNQLIGSLSHYLQVSFFTSNRWLALGFLVAVNPGWSQGFGGAGPRWRRIATTRWYHIASWQNNISPSLKINSLHLKMDDWKMNFFLAWPIFRGYLSFRDCISLYIVGPEFWEDFHWWIIDTNVLCMINYRWTWWIL